MTTKYEPTENLPRTIYPIPPNLSPKPCPLCYEKIFWIEDNLCVNPDGEPHHWTCNLGKRSIPKRARGKRYNR